jgi:hypothetical protein
LGTGSDGRPALFFPIAFFIASLGPALRLPIFFLNAGSLSVEKMRHSGGFRCGATMREELHRAAAVFWRRAWQVHP